MMINHDHFVFFNGYEVAYLVFRNSVWWIDITSHGHYMEYYIETWYSIYFILLEYYIVDSIGYYILWILYGVNIMLGVLYYGMSR